MVAGRTSTLRIALREPCRSDQGVLVVVTLEQMVLLRIVAALRRLLGHLFALVDGLRRLGLAGITVLSRLLWHLGLPQFEAGLDLAEGLKEAFLAHALRIERCTHLVEVLILVEVEPGRAGAIFTQFLDEQFLVVVLEKPVL